MSTETKGKDVSAISIWIAVIGLLIVVYVSQSLIHFTVFADIAVDYSKPPKDKQDITKVENNLVLKILWIVQTAFVLILIFSSCCFVGRQHQEHRASCCFGVFMFQVAFFWPYYIWITMLLFANLDLDTIWLIAGALDILLWWIPTGFAASAVIVGIVAAIAYGGGAVSSACVRCGDAILEAISRRLICKEQDQQLAEEKTAIVAKNNNDAENKSPDDVATV
jgi:hypothetical protein